MLKALRKKILVLLMFEAETEFRSMNSLWHGRKDECHKRINENFSLQKMSEEYKKLWSNNF